MPKKNASSPDITPLADRVLIKPEDETSRETVVAVGEGRIDTSGKIIKPTVKVGNKVIFQWGDKIKIDGEEYYIVSESSILAIIK